MNTESPLVIRGIGAVSVAGWGVADLLDAVVEELKEACKAGVRTIAGSARSMGIETEGVV